MLTKIFDSFVKVILKILDMIKNVLLTVITHYIFPQTKDPSFSISVISPNRN